MWSYSQAFVNQFNAYYPAAQNLGFGGIIQYKGEEIVGVSFPMYCRDFEISDLSDTI